MPSLLELRQYKDLLWLWTVREVRIRYKQSLLGAAWAVLQPLTLTLVFTIIFSRLVKVDTGGIPYPLFAYLALVPWTLFATSLSFGTPSLVNNMNLVSKIYFPREILPLGSIGAALLDYAIGLIILAGMLLFYRVPVSVAVLWIIPLLVVQVVLSVGVTLLGSAIIVFFRDMRFVIPLLTQVWMYASPVIYQVEVVPERFRAYYYLNPMAGIIDGYRRALIMHEAPLFSSLALAAGVSLCIFVIGYLVFKRTEPLFADII